MNKFPYYNLAAEYVEVEEVSLASSVSYEHKM